MTREEFLARIEEIKPKYIQLLTDYLDALLEEDFRKALELSMKAIDVMGEDALEYICEKALDDGSLDELQEKYEESTNRILDALE